MTEAATQAPAYRVEFGKRPAEYLVIVNDEHPFTSWADLMNETRNDERKVVHVERVAEHPEERQAQLAELFAECMENPPLTLLTYAAVSHGHAASLARREFAMASAVARMGEVIDSHLKYGGRGWVAIRIAGGGSDGVLYDSYETARAAQQDPERCTFFQISPLWPWTPRMCEEHLEFMTHLEHGCMFGTRTCR